LSGKSLRPRHSRRIEPGKSGKGSWLARRITGRSGILSW
jgi:hypothetical protein